MSLDVAALRAQLEPEEGRRRSAYQDSLGYWTIGIGRLIDARLKGGLSDDEIDYLFANDAKRVVSDLDARLPWWRDLPEPHRLALADLCFNLGIERLLGFRRMLAALKDGNKVQAVAELKDSAWARQVQPSRVERVSALLAQ